MLKEILSSSKGQLFSYDFFVAAIALAFIILVSIYNFYNNLKISLEERKLSLAFNLLSSVSQIFFEEGIPNDWNETNFIRIGLAKNEQVDSEKLKKLENTDYKKFLSSLGSGIYYVKIEIYNKTNQLVYEYPKSFSLEGKLILKTERKIILNNTYAKGVVYVLEK